MDILTQVLDRVRLGGTLLFHFELGHPWHLELPARPYALFHYLSQGSATLALERPGQGVALSRLTEVHFVEVLRSWIASLSPGQGGWIGAISDPHIGPALKLIHESPEQLWTLSDLGRRVGLGRSAFSARFTR